MVLEEGNVVAVISDDLKELVIHEIVSVTDTGLEVRDVDQTGEAYASDVATHVPWARIYLIQPIRKKTKVRSLVWSLFRENPQIPWTSVYYMAYYHGTLRTKGGGAASKLHQIVFDGEKVLRDVPAVVDINVNVRGIPTVIASVACVQAGVVHAVVQATLDKLQRDRKVREELDLLQESKFDRRELHSRKRRRGMDVAPVENAEHKRLPVEVGFPVVTKVSFDENHVNSTLTPEERASEEEITTNDPRKGYVSSLGAYHNWDEVKMLVSKNLTIGAYVYEP